MARETKMANAARDGDAVLTLSAGNVWQAGDKLLEKLKTGAGGGSKD